MNNECVLTNTMQRYGKNFNRASFFAKNLHFKVNVFAFLYKVEVFWPPPRLDSAHKRVIKSNLAQPV